MIFLGGERDLPYRMTSGRALKLNSSPTNPLLITSNKKIYFESDTFRMTSYCGEAYMKNQKDANIWLAHYINTHQVHI